MNDGVVRMGKNLYSSVFLGYFIATYYFLNKKHYILEILTVLICSSPSEVSINVQNVKLRRWLVSHVLHYTRILALPTRPGLFSPLSFSPTHPFPPQGWTKPTLHTSATDFNPTELYIKQELSESLSISPVLRHAKKKKKKITVFTRRASTFSLHLPQYHLGLRQITCMIPEDNSEDTRSSDSSSGNFPLGTQLVCFFQDIQNLKTRNPSAGASGTFDLQWDNNWHHKGFGELPRSSRNSEPYSPGYRFINCPLPSNSLLP